MARLIVEFGDRYLEWSTVVDAPVTSLMTLDELTAHIEKKYGARGLAELPGRLARVAKFGTSSGLGTTKENLLRVNRAGDNESSITSEAEMAAQYSEPINPDNPESSVP